jgi:hypothetical protein
MNFEQKGICRNHSMQKFILKIKKRYFNNIELNKKNVLLGYQTLQDNLLLNLLTIITKKKNLKTKFQILWN